VNGKHLELGQALAVRVVLHVVDLARNGRGGRQRTREQRQTRESPNDMRTGEMLQPPWARRRETYYNAHLFLKDNEWPRRTLA
jgi:hypothetical protein